MLATEGTLSNVKGCKLIECSEIVQSDHRKFLIDICFAEYFVEEFVEGDKRQERSLNPNRNHIVKNLLRNMIKC